MNLKIDDICNLSRIPTSVHNNPVYKTAMEFLKDPEVEYSKTSLANHYNTFLEKNKSLADLYDINSSILAGYPVDTVFLPWYHTEPVIEFNDVAFIKRNESFGKVQFLKIKSLVKSLNQLGYAPKSFKDRKEGQITGYFLVSNKKRKFYIVSGNHRLAVFFALFPGQSVEHIFEKKSFMKDRDKKNCGFVNLVSYPRYFGHDSVKDWPSVKSGFITKEIAIKILNSYIGV